MYTVARALVVIAGLAVFQTASAALVTVIQTYTQTSADNRVGAVSLGHLYDSEAVNATSDGGTVFAAARTSTATSTGQTVLTGSFSTDRLGSGQQNAYGSGWFRFTALTDLTYVLSGQNAAQDATQTPSRLDLQASIADLTNGYDYVDDLNQNSFRTLDESFQLGDGGGDFINYHLKPSLSGVLLAGHNYLFSFAGFNSGTQAGSSGGHVELTLTELVGTAQVPEPGSLALVGAALLAAAGARRRRG